MESTRYKPTRAVFRCGLTLLGLTCLLGTADARPKPSEQFPGPWLEVTQEIRDVLVLNKVSACSQAVGRQSSRNPGEYLLYCTRDEKLWTSWRVQPAANKVRGPGKLFEGNISVPTHTKSDLELLASHPTRGAYHDRHGRGEGCGGRGSVLRAMDGRAG